MADLWLLLIDLGMLICAIRIKEVLQKGSALTIPLLKKLIRQERNNDFFEINRPQYGGAFRVRKGPIHCTYTTHDTGKSFYVETITVRAKGRAGELRLSIEGIKVVQWNMAIDENDWKEINRLVAEIRYHVGLYASRGAR